ncbi:hypothetical protein [Paraburkholderia saeva]|uniref:hypothetical protein n=1 Tax=Paraburkholderia saeva TaxID=2777537 RepID=UPI001E2980F9|nr:hypothetical protein [Paraburkholderia saeva]
MGFAKEASLKRSAGRDKEASFLCSEFPVARVIYYSPLQITSTDSRIQRPRGLPARPALRLAINPGASGMMHPYE